MLKYGIILMIICLVASLLLAVIFKITDPVIQAQDIKRETESLSEALPGLDNFKDKQIGAIQYYEGYQAGELIGYVVKVDSQGYSGIINMLVGVGLKGNITGVVILRQQETPGLGSNISQIRPGEKKPWFTEQFTGKSPGKLKLGGPDGIQAISGATISSKAVTDGIKNTVAKFLEYKE